jgi:hypothetical protein
MSPAFHDANSVYAFTHYPSIAVENFLANPEPINAHFSTGRKLPEGRRR